MEETEADEQIIDQRCPLADHLRAVQTLLDFLVDRKVLPKKKKPYLVPKLDKLELAHYHGLPKTHKVSCFSWAHRSMHQRHYCRNIWTIFLHRSTSLRLVQQRSLIVLTLFVDWRNMKMMDTWLQRPNSSWQMSRICTQWYHDKVH